MTWRGSYMTDGDAFYHGEELGLARAVRALRVAEAKLPEDSRMGDILRRLGKELMTDGVREALAWLEEQERKRMEKPKMEHDPFIRVVAMDAGGARRFCIEGFGMDPERIEKIEDGGPSGQPEKYKPGARCWHVYTKTRT